MITPKLSVYECCGINFKADSLKLFEVINEFYPCVKAGIVGNLDTWKRSQGDCLIFHHEGQEKT